MGGLPNVHVVDDGDKDRGFMDFVVFGGKSRTKKVVLRDHQSINMQVPQVFTFLTKEWTAHHFSNFVQSRTLPLGSSKLAIRVLLIMQ